MVKTITDHMVRQALTTVVHNATVNRNGDNGITDNLVHSLQEKVVIRVEGNTLVCEDGTRCELVSPQPCTYWKCLTTGNLQKKVSALVLTSNDINYCLGLLGNCGDEFEVRFQVGLNEVRVNKDFININSKNIVINGLPFDNTTTPPTPEEENNGGGG